jgi:hypothetical protein
VGSLGGDAGDSRRTRRPPHDVGRRARAGDHGERSGAHGRGPRDVGVERYGVERSARRAVVLGTHRRHPRLRHAQARARVPLQLDDGAQRDRRHVLVSHDALHRRRGTPPALPTIHGAAGWWSTADA